MKRGLSTAFVAAGLLLGGCSLAGDVTPPPALATAQMAAPLEAPTPAPLIPPATQPDVSNGALIYADKCAPCHGPGGLGDGELANGLAFAPSPLGDPEFAQSADPVDWYRAVTIGNLDRLMPGFTSLTDQERWDVVGFALSLGSPEAAITNDLGTDTDPELQSGSVTGRISNGSVGGILPEDLEVSLLGYDGDQEVVREVITPESDGSFAFGGLDYVPGRLFFATVLHEGLTYRSEVAHVTSDGTPLDLPITIFETTNDPSAMRVERLHIIIDFPAEDVLRVLEVWVLANESDRVLTRPLQVALPEEATNLIFEDGGLDGRFEITGDGFVDLEPIPPGTGIDHLIFGFDLPLDRSTEFVQQMLHPVESGIVLIPADGPRVSGLVDRGVQNLGGIQMQTFATGTLAADEALTFRVSAPLSGSGLPIAAIVGAGALLISALVAVRVWLGARNGPQPVSQDDLIAAIADLDDGYEAGEITESDWRRERDWLKRQALEQMEKSVD